MGSEDHSCHTLEFMVLKCLVSKQWEWLGLLQGVCSLALNKVYENWAIWVQLRTLELIWILMIPEDFKSMYKTCGHCRKHTPLLTKMGYLKKIKELAIKSFCGLETKK